MQRFFIIIMNIKIILSLCFISLLLIFPTACVAGAKNGLLLWFNTIVPTLFPFIAATNILRYFNGIPYIEKLFAPLICRIFKTSRQGAYPIIIGFLCGYPMGAKAISDSLYEGRISRQEAEYLLYFTNNPSPVYLMNYAAFYVLGEQRLGFLMVLITFFISYITSLIFRQKIFQKSTKKHPQLQIQEHSDSNIIDDCIMPACQLILKIGCLMILFSVLSSCICTIPHIPKTVSCILSGLCEQTTGLGLLREIQLPLKEKTVLASGMIHFGGLAIAAQTAGIIHEHGLSLKKYFLGKFICSLIAMCITVGLIL